MALDDVGEQEGPQQGGDDPLDALLKKHGVGGKGAAPRDPLDSLLAAHGGSVPDTLDRKSANDSAYTTGDVDFRTPADRHAEADRIAARQRPAIGTPENPIHMAPTVVSAPEGARTVTRLAQLGQPIAPRDATTLAKPSSAAPPRAPAAVSPALAAAIEQAKPALDIPEGGAKMAGSIITSPLTVGRYIGQKNLEAMDPSFRDVPEQIPGVANVSDKEVAAAGLQTAALAAGPLLNRLVTGALAKGAIRAGLAGDVAETGAVGGLGKLAPTLGAGAEGATIGAAYDPEHPGRGAALGGLLGAASDVAGRLNGANRRQPQMEPDRTLPRPARQAPTATARIVDEARGAAPVETAPVPAPPPPVTPEPVAPGVTPPEHVVVRSGVIGPDGAYFRRTGGTPVEGEVAYDTRNAKLLDGTDPAQVQQVTTALLADPTLTPAQRAHVEGLQQLGVIDAAARDTLPIAQVGQALGYDGIQVAPTDPKELPSVFVWNIRKLSTASGEPAQPVQYGGVDAEGWPNPTEAAHAEAGDDVFDVDHEEVVRQLEQDAKAGAPDKYAATLDAYRDWFGPEGVKVLLAKAQLPETLALATTPTPAPAPTDEGVAAPPSSAPAGTSTTPEKKQYDYSSTQLDLPPEHTQAIQQLAAKIPDAHLAEDGREDQPHITVKYGLHGNPTEKLRALLADVPPVRVTMGKTSHFPDSGSGDVVKVDIDSPALHALNKTIANALPHTDTHPEYKPHATVAYVKKGLGKQYSGDASLAGRTLTFDRLTFSGKDGTKVEIPLGGGAKVPAEFDTPEIRALEAKSAAIPSTHTIDTPERNEWRHQQIDRMARFTKAGKVAQIVMGHAGSGKTSLLTEPLAQATGAALLDSDIPKAAAPEYAGGLGATALNTESAHIRAEAMRRVVEQGGNLVFPTRGDPSGTLALAKALVAHGYTVHVRLMDVPPEVSARRMLDGFRAGTRHFVSPRSILEWGDKPRRALHALSQLDGVTIHDPLDNDVPRGTEPRALPDWRERWGFPDSESPGGDAAVRPDRGPDRGPVHGGPPHEESPAEAEGVTGGESGRRGGAEQVHEDGVSRFAQARTPSGVRRPVARVSTRGLLEELLDLEQKRADAESRAVYELREDPNFHTSGIPQIVSTKTPGGGPSRQAKAGRNLADFDRITDDVLAELARRMPKEDVWAAVEDARAERDERAGAAGDFNPAQRGNGLRDESGAVLFSRPESDLPDLFGEAPKPSAADQGSLFGGKEGTEAARSLKETERAARAELDRLRPVANVPGKVGAMASARIAELEKLVNRDKAISADELRTRAGAEQGGLDFMRTGEGKVGAGFDKSLFQKLGANLYKGDLGVVALKEGLQNASDSLIGRADGAIRVDFNEKTQPDGQRARVLTISDNGHGMSPETMETAFVDIGGSEKEAGAAGGYGLAKVSLFSHADMIEAVSVRKMPDGSVVETRLKGSGKDWQDGEMRMESRTTADAPTRSLNPFARPAPEPKTGTSLRLTFGEGARADPYYMRQWLDRLIKYRTTPWQIQATINGDTIGGDTGAKPAPLDSTPLLDAEVTGAKLDIRGTEARREDGNSYVDVHVLNRGLYQFTMPRYVQGHGLPESVVVNVTPTVDVNSPDYPFTTSREELKKAAGDVVENAVRELNKYGSRNEVATLVNALQDAVEISEAGQGKIYNTSGKVPAHLIAEFAKLPGVADLSSALSAAARDIATAVRGAGRKVPSFHFGGFGIDPSYIGININPLGIQGLARMAGVDAPEMHPTNIILYNPVHAYFELQGGYGDRDGVDARALPRQFAKAAFGTLVHEVAHQVARGHDEAFAGALTRMAGEALDAAPDVIARLAKAFEAVLGPEFDDVANNIRVTAKDAKNRLQKVSGHQAPEAHDDDTDDGRQAGHLRRDAAGGDATGDDARRAGGGGAVGPRPGVSRGAALPRRSAGRRAVERTDDPGARRAVDEPARDTGRGIGAGASDAVGDVAGEADDRRFASEGRSNSPPRKKLAPNAPVGSAAPPPATHPMPEATGLTQQRPGVRLRELGLAIKSLLNPESLGPVAKGTAGTIRHENALAFRRLTIAREALRDFGREIGKLTTAEAVRYWDAAEQGQSVGNAAHDAGNALLQQITRERTDELIALGRLKAEAAIANYLGRFWSSPTDERGRNVLASIMGKRPLEGGKSFLKHRSLERFTDGLDAGLIPATYNYVDAQLAKIAEMERLIAAERMMRREQERGRAKPVMLGQDPPVDDEGTPWVRIGDGTDPAFTIFGSPEVHHWEAVDALVYGKLQKLLTDLKVTHDRAPKIGGSRLGYAQPGKITTKFGGAEGVIMHELGHVLDWQYGLADTIKEAIGRAPTRTAATGKRAGQAVPDYSQEGAEARLRRKTLREELRTLANLRRETMGGVPATKDLAPSDRSYLHSTPEKMANVVEAYISARDRFQQVAPGIYRIVDGIVQAHPELHPLRDIAPSLARESRGATTRVGGSVVNGYWYAPRPAAAVWNNHLSRGLRGNPLYDAYMAPVQAASQLMLGLSGFHATVIASEGVFSDLALAIDDLANPGGKAVQAPGRVVKSSVAPVTLARLGSKVMREFRAPGTHPELATVLDAMLAGGFRGTAESEFWTGERLDNLKRAFTDAVKAESKGRRLWGAARLPLDALWAGLEVAAKPILGKYVPLMKTGATYAAVSRALAKLPADASMEQVHATMADVVKEMDYRFGQVVYDNHFTNTVVKHLAQAVFLAPGWTFGTATLMGRGARDVARTMGRVGGGAFGGESPIDGMTGEDAPPPELVGKSAAYWLGAFAATMLVNGLLTYVNTKEQPHGKDFFAFRDGTKDHDGNWNRHRIPGYIMHDVYGWTHHPVTTFTNKLSPVLAFMERLANNKTYYGDLIYDPDAPTTTKLKDVGKAVVAQTAPISVQNFLESKQRGETGPGEVARSAAGVGPAPREFVRTAAQNKLAEYLARRGHTALTPDQADAREIRRDVLNGLRDHTVSRDSIRLLIGKGDLTRTQALHAMQAVRVDPLVAKFKQLSPEEAQVVYALGTEDEQRLWKRAMRVKAANYRRDHGRPLPPVAP